MAQMLIFVMMRMRRDQAKTILVEIGNKFGRDTEAALRQDLNTFIEAQRQRAARGL